MDDGTTDDQTEALDLSGPGEGPSGAGSRRAPRQPAEGVRIIGAEEAAAAIEAGQVAGRRPEDAPRFGDVPEPPSGPRPSLRFPGADPSAVEMPPVAGPREASAVAGVPDPDTVAHVREPRAVDPPPRPAPDPPPRPAPDPAAIFGRFSPGPADVEPRPATPHDRAPAETVPHAAGSGASATMEPDAPLPGSPRSEVGRRYAGPTMSRGASDDSGPSGAGNQEFWDEPADAGSSEGARFGSFRGAEDSGSMPLPHWTEPPSGEVPRIRPDGDDGPPGDDDLRAWSSLSTGPRWRDQQTDWDDADFGDEMLDDPEMRVGALHPDAIEEAEPEFTFPEPAPRRPQAQAERPATTRIGSGRAATGTTGRRVRPVGAAGQRSRRSASGPSKVGAPTGTPGPPGQSRDLTTSVVTGVVAFGVVLVAAKIGPAALLVLVTAALVVAAGELFQGMRTRGLHPATLLAVVGTAAMSGAVYWRGIEAFHLVLPLFLVFTLLWYLTGVGSGQPVVNASVTLFGFVYVGVLGSYAALLLTYPLDHGIGLLLGAVITTAAYDAGAYLVGRSFGRTPLMPEISPGKTVEGMIGACLITLIAGAVVGHIAPWTTRHGLMLAVVVIVVAPLGDLCESMLKRDLGVKDMGSILPGHGGVLDRIDALLFVVPATYYLSRVLDIF